MLILAALLTSIIAEGWQRLSPQFLDSFASRKPAQAGIKAPLWGSVWVCTICAMTALPVGIATAVYLEEFAAKSRLTSFIRLNITNLSGVPSIVYGIIGLTAFTRMFGLRAPDDPICIGNEESFFYLQLPLGAGVLAGGLTLMLVVLPIVIVASQEALRSVPNSLRQGAMALGATRWQMVRTITLPAAVPTIMTGAILAISRAIGEAAPLLVLGGVLLMFTTPTNLMSDFTVLPLQIFNWAQRPQEEFHTLAAAAIIVQLAILALFNTIAVVIRHKLQRPLQ
ncbi:MAG: phosphate ABC transporter, permease protein PstA [Phycisphaerales bacterium]|nr:phosphate ABC transporter, permease protein PstA [Phycisphaerales bacterium]